MLDELLEVFCQFAEYLTDSSVGHDAQGQSAWQQAPKGVERQGAIDAPVSGVAGGVDPKASGGIHGWVVHRRGKQQGAFEGPSLFVV
jgi:hypothetical protein